LRCAALAEKNKREILFGLKDQKEFLALFFSAKAAQRKF
jgi:hypothetical protein